MLFVTNLFRINCLIWLIICAQLAFLLVSINSIYLYLLTIYVYCLYHYLLNSIVAAFLIDQAGDSKLVTTNTTAWLVYGIKAELRLESPNKVFKMFRPWTWGKSCWSLYCRGKGSLDKLNNSSIEVCSNVVWKWNIYFET